jgi:hypothetical protein
MKLTQLWIRIAPLLLALLLGALAPAGDPVSSQPQREGGFLVVPIPDSAVGVVPLGVMGAGHVDRQWIIRCPSLSSGWPCMTVADKILFTQDYFGGLGITVSGAEVHESWT